MKKTIMLLVFIILSISISFCNKTDSDIEKIASKTITIDTAQKNKLRIITEQFPPYNYMKNGKIDGFSTELINIIMTKLNLSYDIEMLPGSRAHMEFDKGSRILYYSLYRTKEREKLYKWIGPISKAEDAIYFFKKKGRKLNINIMEDAKKVGMVSCTNAGLFYNTLMKLGFKNLDRSPNQITCIKKVLDGKTDLYLYTTVLGTKYGLKKANLPIDALERTNVKLIDVPLYIACSKDIPDAVIQKWQQALDTIKASGQFDRLYKKYIE